MKEQSYTMDLRDKTIKRAVGYARFYVHQSEAKTG